MSNIGNTPGQSKKNSRPKQNTQKDTNSMTGIQQQNPALENKTPKRRIDRSEVSVSASTKPKLVTINTKIASTSDTCCKKVSSVHKVSPRPTPCPLEAFEKRRDPARLSLLDLPDELLLLIAQETARNEAVTIRVPELSTRRRVIGHKQPSIYHLSLASQRLRNVCSEFLFESIKFFFHCYGYNNRIKEEDIRYLTQTFQRHANVTRFIRRVSFPTLPCAQLSARNDHLIQHFILAVIQGCPNLQRITLPPFMSFSQWVDHLSLLQAVNDHPSTNLLILYSKLTARSSYWSRLPKRVDSRHPIPISRVVLHSLNILWDKSLAESVETLLKQGLRVQRLQRGFWSDSSWHLWSSLTYPGLQTVTGWLPSVRSPPINDFFNVHPLLKRFEIHIHPKDLNEFSEDNISWLVANVLGFAKLFNSFLPRSISVWRLISLTLVRRNGIWKVEEVRLLHCPRPGWRLQDFSTLATELRSLLPAQVLRVTIGQSLQTLEDDIVSPKRGLEVGWLNVLDQWNFRTFRT